MRCGVGCTHGSDPALLWLWCSQAATALIRPLAWEPPYAAGVALEKTKRPKERKKGVGACYIYQFCSLNIFIFPYLRIGFLQNFNNLVFYCMIMFELLPY